MHAALPLLQHNRTAALKRPFVLWLLALLVLLKAAVPLLASAAATVRGVALIEVCSVYGVHTQPLDALAPMQHAHHHEPTAVDAEAMDHQAMGHDMAQHAGHGMGDAPANGHSPAVALEHREHCALSPLLGHAIAAAPVLAPVLLHAPAQTASPAATAPIALHDAGRAWLAQRSHAPPLCSPDAPARVPCRHSIAPRA